MIHIKEQKNGEINDINDTQLLDLIK